MRLYASSTVIGDTSWVFVRTMCPSSSSDNVSSSGTAVTCSAIPSAAVPIVPGAISTGVNSLSTVAPHSVRLVRRLE